MSLSTEISAKDLADKAKSMLINNGIEADSVVIKSCFSGGNNRVYLLQASNKQYLLKSYYKSKFDMRDRLKHEWSFLQYAEKIDIHYVPRPIACDSDNNIGIYEYIDGEKLTANELNNTHIQSASKFIDLLNGPERTSRGANLENASEACFSVRDHIQLVHKRVEAINTIKDDKQCTIELKELIEDINSTFCSVCDCINHNGKSHKLSIMRQLQLSERCISPSDFGFHNALSNKQHEIYFIDFEYSGWDDPAKLIADFFCQPQIPVPIKYFDSFADNVLMYDGKNKQFHLERTKTLMPIFQLKWCCIMLNEFLPDASQRRKFAKQIDDPAYNIEQISKAKNVLKNINLN